MKLTESISVREFRDLLEIKNQQGFLTDNPVDINNYAEIIGHYHLKEELRCCRRKENKNLCSVGHNDGYVVRLQDDSTSIVGNVCALTKFGDRSKIKTDASRYSNEQVLQERIKRHGELLGNRDSILSELRTISDEVTSLRQRMARFQSLLGRRSVSKLHSMSRARNANVSISLISKKKYIDEKNKEKVEERELTISLGSIRGANLLLDDNFSEVFNNYMRIQRAFTLAKKFENNPRAIEMKELISQISDYPRVISKAKQLLELEPTFEENNFSLFCYLVSDRDERVLAAKMLLDRMGLQSSKDKCREWLDLSDRKLIEENKVNELRIR